MVEFAYKRPEWIAEFRGEGDMARPRPAAYNEEAVLTLLAYRALDYNGRAYRVAPVSFTDGAQIMRFQHRLRLLRDKPADAETIEQSVALSRDIAEFAGPLLIPCGWRKWIPFRRNPLRRASEIELGEILYFLARCRTTPSGRLSLAPTPPASPRI